jgi:hypothetical protein
MKIVRIASNIFGVAALSNFLEELQMREMIRAHQCVPEGVMIFGDGLLTTVFSCSGYKGNDNKSGILFIDSKLDKKPFAFPPIDAVPIAEATFQEAVKPVGTGLKPSGSIAIRSSLDRFVAIASVPRARTIARKPTVQQLLVLGPRAPRAEKPAPSARAPCAVPSPALLVHISQRQTRRVWQMAADADFS